MWYDKPVRRGKVRDIYSPEEDQLLLVATDRVSVFDVVMNQDIPDKGIYLTEISNFWFNYFEQFGAANHLIETDWDKMSKDIQDNLPEAKGRAVLVKGMDVIPYELIIRGYITGSAWVQYQSDPEKSFIWDNEVPNDLKKNDKFKLPIFTPTTKEDVGHDEPLGVETFVNTIGETQSKALIKSILDVYMEAHGYMETKGLILVDTKFEMAWSKHKLHAEPQPTFVDEILTPDSSRYWLKSAYDEGKIVQYDKQIVRDYVESTGWDKKGTPPDLSDSVIEQTAARYKELRDIIVNGADPLS